tara:strand:+ start:6687 stop:7205 length:519 start_codon:yes stop_codon:yes gene_type:complete
VSLFKNSLRVKSTSTTLGHFLFLHQEGQLFLDAEYQREYVWQAAQQQALLKSIFDSQPIDSVAVSINEKEVAKYCEIVDGKQRLTTLIKFRAGEFPYILEDGTEIFHADMDAPDQIQFKHTRLTSNELHPHNGEPISEAAKIEYFLQKNFGGVPQSEEHRLKVEKMKMLANK